MADPSPPAFSHLSADLLGIDADRLRDTSVLAGLLIASAGAAGFTTVGAPIVRQLPSDDVTGVLLLDHCHIVLYAFPERRMLLLDVLALATSDTRKALDVFARRLEPREIRSDTRARG